jgi:hypothetical protein
MVKNEHLAFRLAQTTCLLGFGCPGCKVAHSSRQIYPASKARSIPIISVQQAKQHGYAYWEPLLSGAFICGLTPIEYQSTAKVGLDGAGSGFVGVVTPCGCEKDVLWREGGDPAVTHTPGFLNPLLWLQH